MADMHEKDTDSLKVESDPSKPGMIMNMILIRAMNALKNKRDA